MKYFLVDKNYGNYLEKMGLSVDEVLKRAKLPNDLFLRESPSLTSEKYFRFMQAIDELSPCEETPVKLATGHGIEMITPAIFAAYCSKDGTNCLKRLSQYKPLIGPLLYEINETEDNVSLEICSYSDNETLPEILVGMEFVFVVNLLRSATDKNIKPICVNSVRCFKNTAYEKYIDIPIAVGDKNCIVFSKKDMSIPFVSSNISMINFFEPELVKRLATFETDDSYSATVRKTLIELLPTGKYSIDDVSEKIGYSKRTLQRRLKEENTNFQKQLNCVRELTAKNYLSNTNMTVEDISFLLGYRESGSFLRAFAIWTWQSPSEYRKN